MKFVYPPRASVKISSDRLIKFDTNEYVGQPKMNGSCGVLCLNEQNAILYERHGGKMTLVSPEVKLHDLYRGTGEMVLCGEYMNKNCKGYDGSSFNHKFVVWDILKYCNISLVGEKLTDRIDLLTELYGTQEILMAAEGKLLGHPHLYVISADLFRVQSYLGGFEKLYKEVSAIDCMEGFVLKRKDSRLAAGLREENNNTWQVKCRKATKNYRF